MVGRFYFPNEIYADYAGELKAKSGTELRVKGTRGKITYFVECPDAISKRSLDDDF